VIVTLSIMPTEVTAYLQYYKAGNSVRIRAVSCICDLQVHSFTGSSDDVLSFVNLGFYIGINGWWVAYHYYCLHGL